MASRSVLSNISIYRSIQSKTKVSFSSATRDRIASQLMPGLIGLGSHLQQRKLPLRSLCLQSCSITHRGLHLFNTAIVNNTQLSKHLQVLNLSGNRIKEENVSCQVDARAALRNDLVYLVHHPVVFESGECARRTSFERYRIQSRIGESKRTSGRR